MALSTPLILNCHVRPGQSALVNVEVNNVNHTFTVTPTINWVASSTPEESHRLTVMLPVPDISKTETVNQTFDFKITSENNDVLICGYVPARGAFTITSQPVWSNSSWQPYDITGHQENDDGMYSGPGSLQILAGQSVTFKGTLSAYRHLVRPYS